MREGGWANVRGRRRAAGKMRMDWGGGMACSVTASSQQMCISGLHASKWWHCTGWASEKPQEHGSRGSGSPLRLCLHSFVTVYQASENEKGARMCAMLEVTDFLVQTKLGEAQQSIEELRDQASCRTAELERGRQAAAADASAAAKQLAEAQVSACDPPFNTAS